jgi:hypothetical protein
MTANPYADKQFPYASPAACSQLSIDLAAGCHAFHDPAGNPKPEGPAISVLAWEVGRASERDRHDLNDAHDLIPDEIAPRKDTTLGKKTSLADRVRMVMKRLRELEGAEK